jgi:NADPH-dependent 2,4-dienoyl-CoA reductase/sulfur reductase-like enzyme/rhodanese-related sulfurtransferase
MKTVIVGGVAGGMSTAARLRRLDEKAEIVVYERDPYVSFANCGLPYHISGEIADRNKLFVVTPKDLERTLALQVHVQHEVTGIDRSRKTLRIFDHASGRTFEDHYDKLVLAPGANPVRPPLPGINHPRIHSLRNISDMDAIKALVDQGAFSAVVVGGGYIGLEMTEALRHRGVRVDLVERSDQLMQNLDPEMSRDLAYHMESFGVNVHLGNSVREFRDSNGRVEVVLAGGPHVLADLVVLAIGVQPENALAKMAGLSVGARGGIVVDEHMRTSDPDIYAVGDAVEVRDATTGEMALIPLAGLANRQGRIAADHIAGRPSAFHAAQGTSVIKVFEMTAGGTGASEKALRRAHMSYTKIYLHPNGHAGYYPGTHPMHLKLLFTPNEGRLLGAQVVGFDGVDKRIDVLATAIRAGMTVYDLEDLELAYAPPYGSAKDPVNMAGFVAANSLRGDVDLWYAEEYGDLPEDALLVDLRSPREYAGWHIPNAINIPVGELRHHIADLGDRKDRPLYLYCLSGFRSYLGTRVLRQHGFQNVNNLSGGLKTFIAFHRNPLTSAQPGAPFEPYAEDRLAESERIPVT